MARRARATLVPYRPARVRLHWTGAYRERVQPANMLDTYMNTACSPLRADRLRLFAQVFVIVGAAALLSACGRERTCVDPDAPYRQAKDHPPLQVPEGLTNPNRSEALAIPEAKAGASTAERSGCLDEPPSYFRSAGTVARSPDEVVASWAQAWASREADAVLALYSTQFQAPTDAGTSAAWLEQRREQVATGPVPDPMIEDLEIEPAGADRRVARFVQKFGTNSLRKELILVREAGSWRIVEEKVSAVK